MAAESQDVSFNFSSDEEYLFVNFCLNMFCDNLPSYCYYFDNSELDNFWNNLSDYEFEIIYKYLCSTNKIYENNNLNPSDLNNKQKVMEFVNAYFD